MARGISSIRKVGQWSLAKRLTAGIGKDIESANKDAMKLIGLEAEKFMIKYIKDQPSDWPALNPEYKAYKMGIRKGSYSSIKTRKLKKGGTQYSEKMLFRTSTMWNSIKSAFNFPTVFIGVKREVKYKAKDGEEEVAKIAAIMNYGSAERNVPARPYLEPTQSAMNKRSRRKDCLKHFY